ncbi:tyrosine-protein kinase receptor TYRO3 isoform X1 [Carcharodon carcharias]|uniref:tyrosine-protein kinase receptor TYRO3 isoform X1 n=1 Tax=Carcharodon carcharias TaxID=13397 RepID=UPI001B7E9488|nr:tyrosine-protein kinase receptor TYRO3 isoform X1 [Carcharodon carcharias]
MIPGLCLTIALLLRLTWGLEFVADPTNVTVSLGLNTQMGCQLKGKGFSGWPAIYWLKDGRELQDVESTSLHLSEDELLSSIRLINVQQIDMGWYWCTASVKGIHINSKKAFLTVEGLPYITVHPQDIIVFKDTPFNLTCAAVGRPTPTEILWRMGGVLVEGTGIESPSVLTVKGIKRLTTFTCEAHNSKGVTVSRTASANVKVSPAKPTKLRINSQTSNNVSISWTVAFDGFSKLQACTAQVYDPNKVNVTSNYNISFEETFPVPPYRHTIRGLSPFTSCSVRLSCRNEVGRSEFTEWIHFQTSEAAPSAPPRNVSYFYNGSSLVIWWYDVAAWDVHGILLGYIVEWSRQEEKKVEITVDTGTQAVLHPFDPSEKHSFRVCAQTAGGRGPWSAPVLLLAQGQGLEETERKTSWAPVIIGILCAVLTLISVLLVMYHIRRKEMQFGEAFGPISDGVGQMVQYRAGRVYNRRGAERIEATFDTLGISNALKQKLEDIFIHERQLELGRTLGRGEFGSVKEAYLKMEDGSSQKLAVKMLKTEINASGDIEEFLREAACMKEFNHPNVIKVIGVSLQSRAHRRLPVPMVLLPFMKHGDLRTYLVLSRLGDQPVDIPVQNLLNFMIDIVKGMEYLSSKNFVHRDLATRNCMLDQDMHVCVADFGLSRKLYSGDYYRQGSTSKLPVKWIALESLADNVYTVHSDVWSFGVTMWEIATRGQTPYPGVENAEIYDYLIRGHRLKQPPDCIDELYKLMHKCWHTDPKLRPSFESLRTSLESLLLGLSPITESEQLLYMNLQGGAEAFASDQGRSLACWEVDGVGNMEASAVSDSADYRYVTAPLGLMEDRREETPANDLVDPIHDGQLEDEVIINL